MGEHFVVHESVRHSAGEYVRGGFHSNTVESYFSILAEFDFRHNKRLALGLNDKTRAERILSGVVGKRLTYETTLERR